MKTYHPNPIDTSDVELPDELNALGEAISKNVHDIWAQNRINEGWTFGEHRDDELKQTPCLVPYEQLPEEEKTYDHDTAFAALKMIYKLGYKIVKIHEQEK